MEHTIGNSTPTVDLTTIAIPTVTEAAEDPPSTASAAAVSRSTLTISHHYHNLLDKSTPFVFYRWIAFFNLLFFYLVRVYLVQGFYLVSYCLGIYGLNVFIGFISPQVDPELSDEPTLPIRSSDEFRPFARRLPEFKFWYSITRALCIAFYMTFFSIFDVPVFWPILLFYWIAMCMLTLRRQILHMMKYKYVPFSVGKQRYDGKKEPSTEDGNLIP